MRLGICTVLERFAEAREAGFAYAEIAAYQLMPEQEESSFAPVRRRMLAAALPVEACNCFFPAHLKVTGPAVDVEALRHHISVTLRRTAEVGAGIMVFGSGGARSLPEGFPVERAWAQLAEVARMAADIAAGFGITVVMEPLPHSSCNLFNRVDQGAALVDSVRHPHLRLLVDLFHITAEGEPFINIAAAGARLAHVHLATPALPETGLGFAYDYLAFFAVLAQAGYQGRYSVEDNPRLLAGKEPPLTEVYRAIVEYLDSVIAPGVTRLTGM